MTGLQPFDPMGVFLIAALNPVVIIVAILMGRSADQWQKLIVAGFAAALAGFIAIWLVTHFKLLPAKGIGGATGAFMIQFVLGTLWASLAYALKRRKA